MVRLSFLPVPPCIHFDPRASEELDVRLPTVLKYATGVLACELQNLSARFVLQPRGFSSIGSPLRKQNAGQGRSGCQCADQQWHPVCEHCPILPQEAGRSASDLVLLRQLGPHRLPLPQRADRGTVKASRHRPVVERGRLTGSRQEPKVRTCLKPLWR